MRNLTAPGWLSRLAYTVAVVSTLGLALSAAGALGDAGNPILGTITGSAVDNGNGTVTISVRGQWNWLSHASDCNADRAGTGVGIIWNDPTETGYTVGTGSISQRVGIALLRNGDTVNTVDRMVHPVDRGNVAEGYVVAGTHYPAKQAIVDPSPPNPASFATWKGGCGRLPLSATASTGANPDRTGLTCGNGTLTCAGRPWGSWGYERTYSHTYLKSALPAGVCVNFYDVHNAKNMFQVVKAAKEITVDGNGDNSIQTNSFNVSAGANCISTSIITPALTTNASSAKAGDPIHDTAQLTGLPAGAGGTITFRAYLRPATTADCSGTAAFTSAAVPVSGSADYASGDFTPGSAGTYDWTASYTGDPGKLVLPAAGPCGATNETSTVDPATVPDPAILITQDPLSQVVKFDGTATFNITVTNTGNTVLADVAVTDAEAPDCARTAAQIAAGHGSGTFAPNDMYTYTCTLGNVTAEVLNVAMATGKPPVGADATSSAGAQVTVQPDL